MTNHNVEQKDLQGEKGIPIEHVQNNLSVRGMLGQRDIKPEELPPAEDIKKWSERWQKTKNNCRRNLLSFQKNNNLAGNQQLTD